MLKKVLLYFAVYAGCFFEGETSLTTSAFAAHRGYLEIVVVMIVALAATQSWDWLWFTIGRKKGNAIIAGKPRILDKSRKINLLLKRHTIAVLLSYRFLYGFRTVVPLAIGMSSISKKKFLFFSLLNTIVWDILFSSLGYFFGAFLKANWKKIESYEIEVMIFIVLTGIAIGYFLMTRSKRAITRRSNLIMETA